LYIALILKNSAFFVANKLPEAYVDKWALKDIYIQLSTKLSTVLVLLLGLLWVKSTPYEQPEMMFKI
jgi:hypothetical protein